MMQQSNSETVKTDHIECNRYGQNQHRQFTSCTRSILL